MGSVFWDPEVLVFCFGIMMDNCSLFEGICAILGCDPDSPLVRPEPQVGYVGSFERLFVFTRPYAQSMIVDGSKVALSSLIDEFLTADVSCELYRRRHMRAYVFCLLAGFLFNRDPGFGDLRLCPLIRDMEDFQCIWGLVLAETLQSLDRAALGFEDWSVSPIILQVTLFLL